MQAAIQNLGDRMVREFMEYRPYVSIQQFRREIGKYVDEAQVAEYEQYVYVPVNANDADEATLRGVMVLMVAGSLLGIYEHVAGNIAFAQEIRPNTTGATLLLEGLTGANPLLAPGMLAVAALIALAATYCHPGLARRVQENVRVVEV